MAFALVLGTSQCKKEETTVTPDNEGEVVHITVNVNDSGKGDKHLVAPNVGAYRFTNGDLLYVGNNGHYVGTLEYQDGAFSGDITGPNTNDYLHFYFTGGKTPSATPSAGSTTSFTVDISDQSGNLPILSYGHSSQKYSTGSASYSCVLVNECALVEFNLLYPSPSSRAVSVGGMLTNATINFGTNPGIIPVTGTTGTISLYNFMESTTSRWAILLPQAEVDDAVVITTGSGTSTTEVPAIEANEYVYGNDAIPVNNYPIFTVSDDNGTTTSKINFAPGNLYATAKKANTTAADNWTWSFAPNQWSYIGNATANTAINGRMSVSTKGTVDLFGWVGASAHYNNYGINNYTNTNTTQQGYNYGNQMNEILKHDWGEVANEANLGGHNDWRTLTENEWEYLYKSRAASTVNGTYNARYIKATLTLTTSICGIIFFPDNYIHPDGVDHQPNIPGSFSNNTYSATDWAKMAEVGAVFLPAAGYRRGAEVNDANGECYYWSASSATSTAAEVFKSNGSSSNFSRFCGCSVRLVREVN